MCACVEEALLSSSLIFDAEFKFFSMLFLFLPLFLSYFLFFSGWCHAVGVIFMIFSAGLSIELLVHYFITFLLFCKIMKKLRFSMLILMLKWDLIVFAPNANSLISMTLRTSAHANVTSQTIIYPNLNPNQKKSQIWSPKP